ncbi:hypothetical protein CMUS01_12353 [Colletotrichum musicola]|uniref:Uncharacterized protein n=1 Tax=Colletotrichum musicola TaxID=2175873 RepID=A0A8H6N0L3_9PEZI|nr:hypothetical protein CMUS01_12353 [Colletotrichum musicola]
MTGTGVQDMRTAASCSSRQSRAADGREQPHEDENVTMYASVTQRPASIIPRRPCSAELAGMALWALGCDRLMGSGPAIKFPGRGWGRSGHGSARGRARRRPGLRRMQVARDPDQAIGPLHSPVGNAAASSREVCAAHGKVRGATQSGASHLIQAPTGAEALWKKTEHRRSWLNHSYVHYTRHCVTTDSYSWRLLAEPRRSPRGDAHPGHALQPISGPMPAPDDQPRYGEERSTGGNTG